jgi:ribosomal protein L17
MNKLNLPFTNDLKGGSKKSFKILNEEQINKKVKKSQSLLNFVKKMIHMNNSNNIENNSNKINFVKASNTKKYYKRF